MCNTYQNKQQSLRRTPTPEFAWSVIASDLYAWQGETYAVTVDYCSKFPEVDKPMNASNKSVIGALKDQICRHGISEQLHTDNGPQFMSQDFAAFSKSYGIKHTTSSLGFLQSNGEAERAVQTVNKCWCKSEDKALALLDYRTTPLESCGLSPAQMSIGQQPRNKIPMTEDFLKPAAIDHEEVRRRLSEDKERQRQNHDQHAKEDLPVLEPGDPVRMAPFPGTRNWVPATVVGHHNTPRSYIVEYNGRRYMRNQRHLQLSTCKAMGEEHRSTKPAVPSSQLLHQPATTEASTADASPHSTSEGSSEQTTPSPARTPPRSADNGSTSTPVGTS